MTKTFGLIAVVALISSGCSSKDTLLHAGDGAVDQQVGGTGGSGGSVTGTGGSGTGGISTGTGGAGSGGTIIGSGGTVTGSGGTVTGTGGIVTGSGGTVTGTGGAITGTGGSGKGGSGSGGTISNGGSGGNGGTTATGGAGGQGGTGQGGSTRVDAAPDVPADASSPDCPAAPSGACSAPSSTICYYGSDPRWYCKTSVKCSQGTWVVSDPMPECTATPDPGCPADPASAPADICAADGGFNATCVYSTSYCKCGYMGVPNLVWVCSKSLPAECPALPPGDGSDCTMTSGVWCTYGPACAGRDMKCIEGKWVNLILACA